MQKLILNIEESRYSLILQFLKTLDYVKVEEVTPVYGVIENAQPSLNKNSQLLLLQETLQKQTTPLFQNIVDPVEWQNQQRDEWS